MIFLYLPNELDHHKMTFGYAAGIRWSKSLYIKEKMYENLVDYWVTD